jgi:hypothetical protein
MKIKTFLFKKNSIVFTNMFDNCFSPRTTVFDSLETLKDRCEYQEAYVTQIQNHHKNPVFVAREVSWKSPLWENCCITQPYRDEFMVLLIMLQVL